MKGSEGMNVIITQIIAETSFIHSLHLLTNNIYHSIYYKKVTWVEHTDFQLILTWNSSTKNNVLATQSFVTLHYIGWLYKLTIFLIYDLSIYLFSNKWTVLE